VKRSLHLKDGDAGISLAGVSCIWIIYQRKEKGFVINLKRFDGI